MALLTALGIIGVGTVLGTSVFLFRRRPKDHLQKLEQKEVLTLTLRGLQDVDMICDTISRGNVVILGVRDLARLDMIRLKRSIQQLKSYTRSYGGDIVALGKDFVVVVPPNMKLSLIKRLIEDADETEEMSPPEPPTEVGTI